MTYKDPENKREWQRQWHQANKDRRRVAARIRKGRQKDFLYALVSRYKTIKGCSECGYNRHPRALDFHHIDASTKKANVTHLINRGHSLATVKAEMSKCVLLCANCHREHHFQL